MATILSGIYLIRNTQNGHRYIGSAKDIADRWRCHKKDLNKNKHHSVYLQRAWNKYGADVFEFTILETCSVSALIWREQHFLDILKPEYNISPTAGSSLGVKHTAEARGNMSKGWKTRAPASKETREKISMAVKGRKHKPESIDKMRIAQSGKVLSKEHIEKLRIAHIGKVPSKETRAKMSVAQSKKTETTEHRKNISDSIRAWWKARKENDE